MNSDQQIIEQFDSIDDILNSDHEIIDVQPDSSTEISKVDWTSDNNTANEDDFISIDADIENENNNNIGDFFPESSDFQPTSNETVNVAGQNVGQKGLFEKKFRNEGTEGSTILATYVLCEKSELKLQILPYELFSNVLTIPHPIFLFIWRWNSFI